MVQTQLASMFIGSPMEMDHEDKLRGVSSRLNATIHILDNQSNQGIILDYVTARNIIEDNHKKSLEDTLETFDFITFANMRYSEHLEKRNRLIIPDEDGSLIEFVIFESAKYLDSEGRKMQVYSHASYLELKKASILYPESYKGTASQHAGRALNDTGWQVGRVEVSGNKTLSRDKHTNPYEFLKHIAQEYEAELKFRIEHDGNKVVGRYVDLLQRVGTWRGREAKFGKDLDSIRRTEEQDIVTALLGLGPEREDGTRIEVLVEDDDALKRWGRQDSNGKLHHLIEAYEIQSERDEMTTNEARRYTRTALNKRINTQVKYEAKIIDLENVPGMENKKIRFGDTIRIKDEGFTPPLLVEARVFEQNRSIKSRAKKDIKLGDFIEYTEEEVNAIWNMLRREIRKKIDIDTLQEYAEPKKIESDEPPEIKDGENPIWIDTSNEFKTPHVVIGNEWQPMSPDEWDISDADRLKEGIVDVGAVPLRTSKTGARIEWDGVNGLVQYDRDDEPVSWLDLEGDAHFENAYLSGRIEAKEGYFGDNIRLSDGKMEIIRPDGAISMSNGMTRASQSIQGFTPKFMNMDNGPGGYRGYAFNELSGYFFRRVGDLDGRSDGFSDIRNGDYRSSVRIQRYQFLHTSRYIVLTYRSRVGVGSGYDGNAHRHLALIYDQDDNKLVDHGVPENTTATDELIADLGTPDFKEKYIDFRIGWAAGWGGARDYINFRINNIVLTDFID